MKDPFEYLKTSRSFRFVDQNNLLELQEFLNRFQDFFQLCEGTKPSALELLTVCPASKNPAKDKFVMGFYDHGNLIGILDIIRDYPENFTWTIGYLMVHPILQSQGTGSSIINDLQQSLAHGDIRKLRCAVQSQNPRALGFWQKNGFTVIGEIQETISDTSNPTFILEKTIEMS